jgi:hypothetical protein
MYSCTAGHNQPSHASLSSMLVPVVDPSGSEHALPAHCTALHRKAQHECALQVRKYAEAALSGALLLGDVPDNPHSRSVWGPLVVDVSEAMEADNAEQLIAVVQHWLSDGVAAERDWRRQRGRLAALSQRTAQRGWERMVAAHHAYSSGARGFMNPLSPPRIN